MKISFWFILTVGLICVLAGCEWEVTGDADTWDDSYSWVNFSGVYRASDGGYLVSAYTTSVLTTSSGGIVVNDEPDGTAPMNQTSLSGSCSNYPGIVPGSVTIIMAGANSAGGFTDDSSGSLSGTFNLFGIDAPILNGAGAINYDTGVWILNLDSPGFMENVAIRLNYTYSPSGSTNGTIISDPGSTGAGIYSISVEQTGNVLVFTDSSGAQYKGYISSVSTAGGDDTGQTSGDVTAQFQVSGTSAGGVSVTIVGSFQGDYTAPTVVGGGSGTLANRVIQATWIEANGHTGDITGSSGSTTTTTTITETE